MKNKLFSIVSAGLFLCLAANVDATVFHGSATGSWENVDSTNSTDLYGIVNNDAGANPTDSALFWWGDPLTGTIWDTGSTRNEFNFNGVGSDGNLGMMDTAWNTPFLLGDFAYKNGDAWYASGVNGVDLAIDFYIQEINQQFTLTNVLTITNTPNITGDDVLDGDIVTMSSLSLTHMFTYNNQDYLFEILGFSQDGGLTVTSDYSSPENSEAFAGLYAQITEVPEPATLLLFGTGIIGLIGVQARRKKA